SRGELIEIGGGFRIPEVIVQGGAQLIEVGTTNRTRLADYEAAIHPGTRILVRVHRSNFAIRGFTAAPEPGSLAALARRHGLPAVLDLGSGALVDLSRFGLPREPTIGEGIAAGFDLVIASGDKLLGGPQAGLLVGGAEAIARCARHPLMRALRPDKETLAALEATLRLYREPGRLRETVPAIRMLALTEEELARRAEVLIALLPDGAGAAIERGHSLVGGGSLPEATLPTRILALCPTGLSAEALAERLRRAQPPLIGRIERGRLLLDPRTLAEDEIAEAARLIAEALR
ncbi:MAG TPA: L-seryl-tRNA(Sec) selenium transferase, partial [Acetobacteraceae bacterium]|nr:L-seryl-tRNA(Sec) selenium transferase [Acetobacteraceae bacterium]